MGPGEGGADDERRGEDCLTVTNARRPRVMRCRQTGQAECWSSQLPMHRLQKTCMHGVFAGLLGVSKQILQSSKGMVMSIRGEYK